MYRQDPHAQIPGGQNAATDSSAPSREQETAPRTLLVHTDLATMVDGKRNFGMVQDGALLIDGGAIAWVGPRAELPAELKAEGACEEVDLGGRLLTPGLIDCHTHLVYGGNRAGEFEQRLQGVSYEEIARAGGGILSSVQATRAASEEELAAAALPRLNGLAAEGVTTLEVKSGYGLDTENELKMLRAARRLGAEQGAVEVVTSFLGAHALPPEFSTDREGYVRLILEEMLPAVVAEGLADAVDEGLYESRFSTEEMERIFRAAQHLGLPLKLHAEQLSDLGGTAMAARLGALSADHLEYLGQDGVEALAASGTVAVLLPGAFYYLHETRKPPVAALVAADVPMAVATDHNPGSSPIFSLLAAMNMACVLFGLTPEQALRGTTANAARALGLADRGQLRPGLRADLALWEVETPGELSYALGRNPCVGVVKSGRVVLGQEAWTSGELA